MQTALNLAIALAKRGTLERLGIRLIGASRRAVEVGEDRQLFKEAMARIGLDVPRSSVVKSLAEAKTAVKQTGIPAIIRPSFTMGGSGGALDEHARPAFVIRARGEFGDVVGRRVAFESGDFAKIVHGVRGVGRAAADAEDEEPAAATAEGDEFANAFFAIVGIQPGDNLGGFFEVLDGIRMRAQAKTTGGLGDGVGVGPISPNLAHLTAFS